MKVCQLCCSVELS